MNAKEFFRIRNERLKKESEKLNAELKLRILEQEKQLEISQAKIAVIKETLKSNINSYWKRNYGALV